MNAESFGTTRVTKHSPHTCVANRVTKLLTVLQAVPQLHSQTETGRPGPTGSPLAQLDTKCPTGRTVIKRWRVYNG